MSTTIPATATRPQITLPDVRLVIGAERREAASGETFAVLDPTTEELVCEVPAAGPEDADLAVRAAARGLDAWARVPRPERARMLLRLADLIERDADYCMRLDTLDMGQPASEWGIANSLDTLRWFAGRPDAIDGRVLPAQRAGGDPFHVYTRRDPVGVVAAITPWNGPLVTAAWKTAPALASGCSVVVKPPEDAPLSTLHFAGLCREAGIPAGVVNVLPGLGHVAGAALVDHPGVAKVSFTGSPEVGSLIARATADTFKRVTLELGGKSPSVIFSDANLDEAVPEAARGFIYNAGQICAAGTRILVANEALDAAAEGLVEAVREVRTGDPFDPETTIGPLINAKQRDRVRGYIDAGIAEGAELLTGGEAHDGPGFFVTPTLFRGSNDLRISQEEIFGPVATLIGFEDEEEAIRIANATRYGLSSNVWTRDLARGYRVASRLRIGAVRINGASGGPNARLPWGGFKISGIGRELGPSGIDSYTREQTVAISLR